MKLILKNWLRLRPMGLGIGSLIVVGYLYLSDPNGGALLPAFLGQLATPIIAVWFALVMRKILLDYVKVEELYAKLKETSVGAGIGFLGVSLIMYGLLGLFGGQVRAQDVSTYIPTQANTHVATVKKEQVQLWNNHPFPGSSQV